MKPTPPSVPNTSCSTPASDLGFACLDLERRHRQGIGEVILAEGKTAQQLASIFQALLESEGFALATRTSPEQAEAVISSVPGVMYREEARVLTAGKPSGLCLPGKIAVVTAGTSDLPVAEEAAEVALALGQEVDRIYDIGVAGLHRLLTRLPRIRSCRVIIVVAGMEGALPSVVAGLVDRPVIAVPTSVGYGSHFEGLAALLGMLNSCGSGVTVVNIDNGFGAAFAAVQINRLSG